MDKRYVLRKPIEAHYVSDSNEWYIETLGYINNGEFDEIFIEFNVDATRKQIEELFYEYEFDADSSTDITFDPDKLPLFINKVLALLGGTTNGK